MLEIARSAHLSEDDDEAFEHFVAFAERDDLCAALDWDLFNDRELGLELTVALENFWNSHAPQEGVRRVDQLLIRADEVSDELKARALRVYGGASDLSGRWYIGERSYEQSRAIFQELGNERAVAALEHRLPYPHSGAAI